MTSSARRWGSKRVAAKHAGTSVRTIERWIDTGKLTGYRAGPKLVRIDLDELDALFTPIPLG
ncbi:excisionase family DNA-binding protein [Rhodococcus koreensis]